MDNSILALMDTILDSARQEKRAAKMEKKATDPSEPTSHPVMSADDGTQKATEGSRSSENKSDVRKDYGEAGILGQEDGNSVDEKKPSDSIGTQTMASDEMKGNAKRPGGTKENPSDESPEHPSNQTFSEKYSAAHLAHEGNTILANISGYLNKFASVQPAVKRAAAAPAHHEKLAAAEKYREDAEAGYVSAQLLCESLLSKRAEDQASAELVTNITKTAQEDAAMVADYLRGYDNGVKKASAVRMYKRAEGEEAMGMIPPEAMAGGMPEGMPEGGEGGISPEMLQAAGGQGGEAEAAIEALAQELEAAGVTPDELQAALSGGGGGADEGGGMSEEQGESPEQEAAEHAQ